MVGLAVFLNGGVFTLQRSGVADKCFILNSATKWVGDVQLYIMKKMLLRGYMVVI